MVDIFIPNKEIRGRANAETGRILFKNPNGIILLPGTGKPSWIDNPYTGTSVLDPAPLGFTAVPVTSDSRLIYVDPDGNDANSGESPSLAVNTLVRARALQREGYPDRVLLKRGGSWREPLQTTTSNFKSGHPDMPAVLGWYGDPSLPRPTIEYSSTVNLTRNAISHFQMHGIRFYSYAADPANPEYSWGTKANLMMQGGYNNILFEDCEFRFTELVIQTHSQTGDQPLDLYMNWCLHNGKYVTTSSASTSSRPSNVYILGWRKLRITNCVADTGGWHPTIEGAGANTRNHNYYLNYEGSTDDLIFEDNISTRASSHGVQLRPGGIARNNFLGRNACGILMGYGLERFELGEIGHVYDNVVTEGWNMYRGVNACQNGVCSTAVYGIDFDLNGDLTPGNFQCKRNIVSYVDPVQNAAGLSFFGILTRRSIWHHNQNQQTLPGVVVDEDNITWKWATDSEGVGPNYREPGRTLSDYYKFLHGTQEEDTTDRFDDFIQEVLARPPRCRDTRYEAQAINSFIREGFEIL